MEEVRLVRRIVYSWKPDSEERLEALIRPAARPTTRSPGWNLVTPGPTSTTEPATSVPRMKGRVTQDTRRLGAVWIAKS